MIKNDKNDNLGYCISEGETIKFSYQMIVLSFLRRKIYEFNYLPYRYNYL